MTFVFERPRHRSLHKRRAYPPRGILWRQFLGAPPFRDEASQVIPHFGRVIQRHPDVGTGQVRGGEASPRFVLPNANAGAPRIAQRTTQSLLPQSPSPCGLRGSHRGEWHSACADWAAPEFYSNVTRKISRDSHLDEGHATDQLRIPLGTFLPIRSFRSCGTPRSRTRLNNPRTRTR